MPLQPRTICFDSQMRATHTLTRGSASRNYCAALLCIVKYLFRLTYTANALRLHTVCDNDRNYRIKNHLELRTYAFSVLHTIESKSFVAIPFYFSSITTNNWHCCCCGRLIHIETTLETTNDTAHAHACIQYFGVHAVKIEFDKRKRRKMNGIPRSPSVSQAGNGKEPAISGLYAY